MRLAIRSGWKTSKSSSFSPVGREQDRHAGDLAHRQRGATAGVAVELGQHDAGEADALAERLGGGDGVLADHRVEDEQHLVGVDGVADGGGLAHQLLVDAEAARGVDDDDVEVLGPGLGEAGGGDRDGVAGGRRVVRAPRRCRRVRREDRNAGAFADDLQLVDRAGALQVAGHQQRRVALALEPLRELARQRGLTGALQAGQHDDRRRRLGVAAAAGSRRRGCRRARR